MAKVMWSKWSGVSNRRARRCQHRHANFFFFLPDRFHAHFSTLVIYEMVAATLAIGTYYSQKVLFRYVTKVDFKLVDEINSNYIYAIKTFVIKWNQDLGITYICPGLNLTLVTNAMYYTRHFKAAEVFWRQIKHALHYDPLLWMKFLFWAWAGSHCRPKKWVCNGTRAQKRPPIQNSKAGVTLT